MRHPMATPVALMIGLAPFMMGSNGPLSAEAARGREKYLR